MSLQVCGLLILLGLIFAAMILVGLRWCGRGGPAPGGGPGSTEADRKPEEGRRR